MGVKHASCVEARVDQRLGDMNGHFLAKQFTRDPDTCLCIGVHGNCAPYTKYLKSASVEVLNWNLLNDVDFARHIHASIPQGHGLRLW